MCCTNERYKDFHSVTLVMPQGSDFGAIGGCPGGGKKNFKHGLVAYQIDGDDEQTKKQVKFSSYVQTGDLGVRSKGRISLNFGNHANFYFLYQTWRMFSQI